MSYATTTQSALETVKDLKVSLVGSSQVSRIPLRQTGALDRYSSFEVTPAIGTEFRSISNDGKENLDVRKILDDDKQLRDLAVLIAERGVVFFRDQTITPDEQKKLVHRLGQLTGKPESSTLHIHPLTGPHSELGDEISVISSDFVFDDKFRLGKAKFSDRPKASVGWHTDITFEPIPSDYATLQIRQLPSVGGDTLWASAYTAFDRLSPAYQKFLEGLTATHAGDNFVRLARAKGEPLRETRGSPQNIGQDLEAVHPVVRTNPVTGWKGLFVNRGFTRRINELSPEESNNVLNFLYDHISANHDIQVRFRWEENSLAIWDNRSTFHTATKDFEDAEKRIGTRAVSIGEKPYLDPNSKTRREYLSQDA